MRSLIEIFVIAVVFVFLYEKYVGELPTVELDIKTTKSERKHTNENVDFYIRPLGDVDNSDLTDAVKHVENFYGYKCKIKPGVEITENMKINGTDEIINANATIDELKSYRKTIFVVDKRLWHFNQELKGFTNGRTILVKGQKSWLKETLIHEIGHTLGLKHCDDLSCIMALDNDEYETGKFCNKCQRKLKGKY